MQLTTSKRVTSAGTIRSADDTVVTEITKVLVTVSVLDESALIVGSKAYEIPLYKTELDILTSDLTGEAIMAMCEEDFADDLAKFERDALYEFTPQA